MTEAGLRIAMVTTFYPPFNFGGDGVYVQRLARALAARGHHVEVIHDTDGYRALSGTTPEAPASDNGIPVHRLASNQPVLSSLAVQQLGHPARHRAALRDLLTDRFDVIHFHNVSLIGGPGIWKYGTGVKLHTAHEHWMVCPTHILWRDNREICDKRRCLRCVLRHRRPPQLWRATNLISREARHVDRFLMLSQSSADNHRRFGFAAPMTVFPSFLPKSEDSATEATAPGQSQPFILFVGRLEIIKGLQDVIPTFKDLPAELWIAGTGNYEDKLRALAAGNPKVRFLGRKPMHELRQLYRDAVAVVTPSRCYEVFPMVVLEAFREATPIVARALGPYPEIIEAGGGGQLFTTVEDLRAALAHYIDNPAAAAADGQRGRETFDRLWSEDVVIGRYFQEITAAARDRGLDDIARRAAKFTTDTNDELVNG